MMEEVVEGSDYVETLINYVNRDELPSYEALRDVQMHNVVNNSYGIVALWIGLARALNTDQGTEEFLSMGETYNVTMRDLIGAIVECPKSLDDKIIPCLEELCYVGDDQECKKIINTKVLVRHQRVLGVGNFFSRLPKTLREKPLICALALCNGADIGGENAWIESSPRVLSAYPLALAHMSPVFRNNRHNQPAIKAAIRGGALEVPGLLAELPKFFRKTKWIVMDGIKRDSDALQMVKTWILRYITNLDRYGQPRAPLDANGNPNPQLVMVDEILRKLSAGPATRYKAAIACLFMKKQKSLFYSLPDVVSEKLFCGNGYDYNLMCTWGTDWNVSLVEGLTVDEVEALFNSDTFERLVRLHGAPRK